MAINNINNLANNRLQNTGNSQGTGSKSVASSPDSKSTAVRQDSVSLTNEAQQLQKMQQNLNAASTGNESKVERLKKAVASGEYQVNNEAVARKMFSFETNLDKMLG
ncbi:flagellar biosynthesis anti-sigma factor FlgM [Aeromonas enteropelogenes]|uniref:Negative regulator of flagellin synthesis n=1 Tax=Aeromonas enteropelogenes TaxID=29489 RepID=A0A175VMI3_AEREN|nr:MULTISPECIES: flagellar biosynthesis anti-sigma factor FlgM [Aeromonas]KXU81468.1 flagellar biosynthesis anti-sigma factor FlgM [Aeromonas enteropelogenes]MBL0456074.1 flagellar biosynthesis anti-sigma factor FlgM [Aeromonas enteropelogenes]MBL0520040.1 flagellar biosynthesis anti-sigma factor FlgM [Aeromonas enteropelogenes]MCZ0750823.1 flagellar biosynthesis anti-sigma factor FlgM [Aeromonas enteropelogenes]QXC32447.1 flagellar biosynthesis anti-sigma factor FlgM [Aeromonas sp. FDAARGOS 1